MAGKNLLTKTSKPKKQKFQSKKVSKDTEYKFEIGDILIYLGSVIESQNKQECKVISRSRNSYKVEFADEQILECIPDVLIYVSEFEAQLAQAEDNQDDADEISDEEQRILDLGLEPYHNKHACLNQVAYYERRCDSCVSYKDKCIYVGKGKYKKLDNN